MSDNPINDLANLDKQLEAIRAARAAAQARAAETFTARINEHLAAIERIKAERAAALGASATESAHHQRGKHDPNDPNPTSNVWLIARKGSQVCMALNGDGLFYHSGIVRASERIGDGRCPNCRFKSLSVHEAYSNADPFVSCVDAPLSWTTRPEIGVSIVRRSAVMPAPAPAPASTAASDNNLLTTEEINGFLREIGEPVVTETHQRPKRQRRAAPETEPKDD